MDSERPLQVKSSLYEAKQVEHLRDGYSGCMFEVLSGIRASSFERKGKASGVKVLLGEEVGEVVDPSEHEDHTHFSLRLACQLSAALATSRLPLPGRGY